MTKAVAIVAMWYQEKMAQGDREPKATFAYDTGDETVIITCYTASVEISKKDLLEIARMVFPHFINLPDAVVVKAQPEPVEEPGTPKPPPPVKKKRRSPKSYDWESHPNSMKTWQEREDSVLIENHKALGDHVKSTAGLDLLFETTAKQLGRSKKSIRARHFRLRKQGLLA